MNSAPLVLAPDFSEIVQLIESARQRATQAVNVALIDLYWQVGKTISEKLAKTEWGEGVVDQLAAYIARTQPGLRGFARPNLYRMRQFYEAYEAQPNVSALLRHLSWTHHLAILGQCKQPEERQFYIELSIREKWSSRELER
jgi:predicted nuclease of restriction endonuclease-like (RecB) superfamily